MPRPKAQKLCSSRSVAQNTSDGCALCTPYLLLTQISNVCMLGLMPVVTCKELTRQTLLLVLKAAIPALATCQQNQESPERSHPILPKVYQLCIL